MTNTSNLQSVVGSVAVLLLALLGLGIMLFGKSALSFVFKPIGWLFKRLISVVLVILVGLLLMSALMDSCRSRARQWLSSKGSPSSEERSHNGTAPWRGPVLSQKDPKNYRDQTVMTALDGTKMVQNLACLATCYVMLERFRGNSKSFVDDFYPDPRLSGGSTSGARRPSYVGSDVPITLNILVEDLRDGHPVILHATNGPLGEHFVLCVGLDGDTAQPLAVCWDPWPAAGSNAPGQRVLLSVGASPIRHPNISGMTFSMMRRTDGIVTPHAERKTQTGR